MIYEFRTYTVRAGKLDETLERYGEAYETRKDIKPLAAFWVTEIGPVNQIIQVWPWEDLVERERLRVELAKLSTWPPGLGPRVVHQEVELFNEFPFVDNLQPGNHGPVYEMRSDQLGPGAMRGVRASWEKSIPEIAKATPVVGALFSDMGTLNKVVRIMAHASLEAWGKANAKADADSAWPAGDGDILPLAQQVAIMRPAAFSPMQ